MKVRYQADNDFDQDIVRAVKRWNPGIDFQSAAEARDDAGLDGIPDEQVLAIAAQEGRILVSHDLRTMPIHFAHFIATGTPSPGVLIIPQNVPLAAAVDNLVLIWGASEAEEWINLIQILRG